MTLFTNPNFIDHIVKSQVADEVIGQEHYPLLQTLIELQTRHLLETAIKFMRRDRRDILSPEDLTQAAREQHHGEMVLLVQGAQYQSKNEQIFRVDRTFSSPEALFEEEMKMLGTAALQQPRLRGQWIYLNGKVPSTPDNAGLKTLAQLTSARQHESQEKKKLFNIIRDQSISLLTKEETEYFRRHANIIYSDVFPAGGFTIQGNIARLLPFFLAFIGSQVNDSGIHFLLKALQSKYIDECLEFNLKRILAILLSYKGALAFTVGETIAQLVDRFADRYPILLDIYEGYEEGSYSTFLKKIAFQLRLGVPFTIEQPFLSKLQEDSNANEPLAAICLRTLLAYSSKLPQVRELIFRKKGTCVYWMPCTELKHDPYLATL